MKANETKVQEFLSSPKTQFIIPVYQRNYDWTFSQCGKLLDDIWEVGSSDKMSAHFIGSIVYFHDDVYSTGRIKEFTIIDGQQRLTSLTLIYLVLKKLARKLENFELEEEILELFLINKQSPDDNKLKLRPTENNEGPLIYLLRDPKDEEYNLYSNLIDNYNYFKSRITEGNYEYILNGLSKLIFVEISLQRGADSPQRIFESLNSTGLELSQADLIRNYILIGLDKETQIEIYKTYWEYIEINAKNETKNESKVSDFIRDYLTVENKKIPNKKKVYEEFKIKFPENKSSELQKEKLSENLSEIKSLVKNYNKLINPQNEPDKDIRQQLKYINRLEINVAYPFLMKIYKDFTNQVINKFEFLAILTFLQSFTWRRFIVGLPTNALNKIFMILYDKVDKDDYLTSIQNWLLTRTGTQRFPKNQEVLESLKTKDVYNIQSKNRTYFLERLENFENTEPVLIDGNSDITIEHIFPKNPDSKWKMQLGNESYNYIKENYLNTIANLTLSGNNGRLGNKYFTDKRDMENFGYRSSRLWLNKYLAKLEKWDIEEIEKRLEIISRRFLLIWPYPEIKLNIDVANDEVNIFEAEDPKFKKLDYAIFLDQKLEINNVSRLYTEVVKQLFEFQPETFFKTDLGERIGLTKTKTPTNPRQPIQINDTYFIEGNLDSVSKFDRIKHALTIFEMEDELTIKYTDE